MLVNKKLVVNNLQFPCLVLKINDFNNDQEINLLENEFVLCYFYHLRQKLVLDHKFTLLAINSRYLITEIYHDLAVFFPHQVVKGQTYWLVPNNIAKKINFQIQDYFFVS